MPSPERNGFVPTLNQQGYMTSTIDRYMAAFIDYAANCSATCVDIGAAYGIASIEALSKGAKIIANDLDMRHLQILKDSVPQNRQKNLQLMAGKFPDGIDFLPGSIGGFLLARVVHFFKPAEFVCATQKLFDWLMPGGRIFLTAETPYLGLWESFIPIFEKKRAEGDIWAGQIDDIGKYAPQRAGQLPKEMLVMDPDVLRYVFEGAGFEIELVDYFARPEFPEDLRLNNKESVGLVALKPHCPAATK